MNLTKTQIGLLKLYRPETYAIHLGRDVGSELEKLGLVEWVPPVWGNSYQYRITEAGKLVVEKYKNESVG